MAPVPVQTSIAAPVAGRRSTARRASGSLCQRGTYTPGSTRISSPQKETRPMIQASGSPVRRRLTSESRRSPSPAALARSSAASSSAAMNPALESSAASAWRSLGIGTHAIAPRSRQLVLAYWLRICSPSPFRGTDTTPRACVPAAAWGGEGVWSPLRLTPPLSWVRLDPREIVRAGYDTVSDAYRDDQGGGPAGLEIPYADWLAELIPRLTPSAPLLDRGCG